VITLNIPHELSIIIHDKADGLFGVSQICPSQKIRFFDTLLSSNITFDQTTEFCVMKEDPTVTGYDTLGNRIDKRRNTLQNTMGFWDKTKRRGRINQLVPGTICLG
jgi:hypothetical protein